MISQHRARIATLPALALAGLLAGHRLTYMALAPADHGLTASTHGYLGPAGVTALALGIMAGLFFLAVGAMRRRHLEPPAMRMLGTLSMIQVAGFGLQETLERAVVGASMQGLGTVLLLGVPLQLVVAAVAALLAVGLYKAGGALARLLSAPRPSLSAPAAQAFPASVDAFVVYRPGRHWTRGPPIRPVSC